MNITVETPAALITHELPKLPALVTDRAPVALEAVSPTFKKLSVERQRLFAEAVPARTEADRAAKAVAEGRARDQRELADAAKNGKPDPGRPNELAALTALHEAHRKAEGLTVASNEATHQLAAALKGDEGQKAIETLTERTVKERERMREGAETALDALGSIAAADQLTRVIEKARKGGHYGAIPKAPERVADIRASGMSVDPRAALAAIIDYASQEHNRGIE